jgi:UDP-glucuronate 4-epimerase
VTGGAGFIGSHVVEALLRRGDAVVALDNLNGYYEPRRKRANLEEVRSALSDPARLIFVEGDIRDGGLIDRLFREHEFEAVVHLAAMAGVRASIADPALYFDVNLAGTLVLLDAAVGRSSNSHASHPIFLLASTSSVYGDTSRIPFVETDPCDRPLAPYAASKRAAELTAFTYHHLYGLDVTVTRFFTVYGPRGRPDMMAYKVADSIYFGHSVPLFNNGQMYRDWTYVGDIVAGLLTATERRLGYEVINLGRGQPVLLSDFVHCIEETIGRTANLTPAPPPDTDLVSTHADTSKAARLLDYAPRDSVRDGVQHFLEWYARAVLQTPELLR